MKTFGPSVLVRLEPLGIAQFGTNFAEGRGRTVSVASWRPEGGRAWSALVACVDPDVGELDRCSNRPRELVRRVVLRDVVNVDHRRLDVRVAHVRLHV